MSTYGIAGVERLCRARAAGVEAGDRIPDHRQRRRGVDGKLAADRRLAEAAQLRVDVTAVEDQVRAPERLPVRRRRMRWSLRAAVAPRRRVETPRVVHLGHHPHVDPAAVSGDRLVERDEIRVAEASRDPGRRDRLGWGARPRSVPMWIIGIGFSPAKSSANGDPQLLPCPQPRKICRTCESWPVWRSKRSAWPAIPSSGLLTASRAPRAADTRLREQAEARGAGTATARTQYWTKEGRRLAGPGRVARLARGRGSRAGTDASRRAPAWRPARGGRRCAGRRPRGAAGSRSWPTQQPRAGARPTRPPPHAPRYASSRAARVASSFCHCSEWRSKNGCAMHASVQSK